MSDEKPFDLRDQFAMAAMQALIAREHGDYPLVKTYIKNSTGKVQIDEWEIEKMERFALAAYKMADVMRKARLKAFG